MARKNKKISYSKGCLAFLLMVAISLFMLNLPYLSGGNMTAIPSSFVGNLTNIFAIVVIALKILPLVLIAIIVLAPIEIIKKYVITAFFSLWLSVGEIVSEIIMLQYYEGTPSIGFIISVVIAISLFVLTPVFTKMSPLPAKHKEMVWYKSLNNIITILVTPCAIALTIAVILFYDVVFNFEIYTIIGIMLLWVCLAVSSAVSIFTLFEKYKTGMLYYIVAFLNALSVVFLSWSSNIGSLLLGAVMAALFGMFWLFMGSIVKRNF